MLKITLFKTIALSAILLTAMAFSCQDHYVPEEPETAVFPSNACGRTNGQPRAFPCEFEVVKVDFVYGKNDLVAGTATQTDSMVHITRGNALYFNTLGIHGGFLSFWRTRVTIRRIGEPAIPGAKEYIFRTAYRGWTDQLFDPITPRDNVFEKHVIDIPVGATYTFASGFSFEGTRLNSPTVTNNAHILIQNVATSAMLQKPPYSYDDYWDMAEGKMITNMVLHF